MPLPDSVTAFLEAVPSGRAPLPEAIRAWLGERLRDDAADRGMGRRAAASAPARSTCASSTRPGASSAATATSTALRAKLGEAAQMTFAAAGPALELKGMRSWDCGDLPPTLTRVDRGQRVTGYPALVDDTDSVSLALLDTAAAAERSTRAGVIRLIRFALKDAFARFEKGAPGFAQAALQLKPVVATDALLADVLAAIADRAFIGDDALPRSASGLRRAGEAGADAAAGGGRGRLPAAGERSRPPITRCRSGCLRCRRRSSRLAAELRARRDALVHAGFFRATPWAQLNHLPRYLAAAERRLVKHAENPDRDARHAATLADWWRRLAERREAGRAAGRVEPGLDEFRWLLEELTVSLFAQELRTPQPVSLQAARTRVGGARALTGGVFARWQRVSRRATVS